MREFSWKIIWRFLQPSIIKLLLTMLLLALALFAVLDIQAASKVYREENRGIPLSFVTISIYEGPCRESDFCRDVDIQNINLYALIGDVAVWYLVSCITVSVFRIVKTQNKT
jgi:hypothetical protein